MSVGTRSVLTVGSAPTTLRKLDIGCGTTPLAGYEGIDRLSGSEAYPLAGIADDCIDEVYASHVLEHFPHEQTVAVLQEWVRVLKPGRPLYVAVPDFDKIKDKPRL